MAKDVLSIPGSGAGVERLFNQGRDIASYRRGRLQAKTIETLMILKMHPYFITYSEELVEMEG